MFFEVVAEFWCEGVRIGVLNGVFVYMLFLLVFDDILLILEEWSVLLITLSAPHDIFYL